MRASSLALRSYASGSRQVERGSSSFESTPDAATGTLKPNVASSRYSTESSPPDSAECSSARVAAIGIRCPSPNGPPVHPVLTSQTVEPCAASFSPSSREYTVGGCGRKGAPKQV